MGHRLDTFYIDVKNVVVLMDPSLSPAAHDGWPMYDWSSLTRGCGDNLNHQKFSGQDEETPQVPGQDVQSIGVIQQPGRWRTKTTANAASLKCSELPCFFGIQRCKKPRAKTILF